LKYTARHFGHFTRPKYYILRICPSFSLDREPWFLASIGRIVNLAGLPGFVRDNYSSQLRGTTHGFSEQPRGDDWTGQLVRDICAVNRLVRCVDPFVRDSTYGESIYWRLHGRGGYRYRYSDSDLAELNSKLQTSSDLAGLHYIMFNNTSSREDALHKATEIQVISIATDSVLVNRQRYSAVHHDAETCLS
jgi:hypothetical protein